MGGYRSDGKLLASLQKAVEVLHQGGYDELSDDVEEAIARLRSGDCSALLARLPVSYVTEW